MSESATFSWLIQVVGERRINPAELLAPVSIAFSSLPEINGHADGNGGGGGGAFASSSNPSSEATPGATAARYS